MSLLTYLEDHVWEDAGGWNGQSAWDISDSCGIGNTG